MDVITKQKLNITVLSLLLGFLGLSSVAFAHGVDPEDIRVLSEGGYLAYIWLGAKHMLTGYDHLLFILAAIFFLTRYLDILKFITAFTVGHSITLIVGTIFGWTVNYYLIDAIIALTICYKGFENLDGFKRYLRFEAPPLVLAVFVFGLIHGLGLSTRLQQLPLPEDSLILHILAFNVGVELGQVAVLAGMLAGVGIFKKSAAFKIYSGLVNKGLITAGVALFVFQMHGYSHLSFPDDMGFSEDLHEHAHEKMTLEALRAKHSDSLYLE